MSVIGDQKQKIDDIRAARYITGALRDIAAVELKDLRKKFERNDMFYTELIELFHLVWKIAVAEHATQIVQKDKGELYLAYTTNKHFYGTLNNDVMQKLIESTNPKHECLIIGDTGKRIWESRPQQRKQVDFISFKEDDPDAEELDSLMKTVDKYQNVFVFYPGFTSVFRQDVRMIDITYRPSNYMKEKDDYKDLPQYLFEPDLSEMVKFFNSQVRYVLLERLLLETQISRVAARLVKMDSADQNAGDLVIYEMRKLRRVRTTFSSRRMLETVVGYIQWHNRQKQLIGQ
ncbi:F0F1 ATP synthase subunit gamma [Crocinitomicaceae bacterium]|nr:F0F1 ATP synthase subunit gamma [Crocinitomicaceae bacterium]